MYGSSEDDQLSMIRQLFEQQNKHNAAKQEELLKSFSTMIDSKVADAIAPVADAVASLRKDFDTLRSDVSKIQLSEASEHRVPSSDDGPSPRARDSDGQAPRKGLRSSSPPRRASPPPASSRAPGRSLSRSSFHPPPATSASSLQDPVPDRLLHLNTVFIGLYKTRLYTKRAKAMAIGLLQAAFLGQDLPEHVIIHENDTSKIKVRLTSKTHFDTFLAHLKSHSPYKDEFNNLIPYYAKPDASQAEQTMGRIFHLAYKHLVSLQEFDHDALNLSTGRRRGLMMIDFKGIAYSLKVSKDDSKAVVVPGDIADRLDVLPPGLSPALLAVMLTMVTEGVDSHS